MIGAPLNNYIALIGAGDNGKSTFLRMLRTVFERYCVGSDSKAMDADAESSKAFNALTGNTLFYFMDETEESKKKNSSKLKTFSDGNVV
jgi:phage/plasmid-associated DNA primase